MGVAYKGLLAMLLIGRYLHFSNSNGDFNKDTFMVGRNMQIKISEALKPSLEFRLYVFSRVERPYSPQSSPH